MIDALIEELEAAAVEYSVARRATIRRELPYLEERERRESEASHRLDAARRALRNVFKKETSDLGEAILRLRNDAQELGYHIAKGGDDDDLAAWVNATNNAVRDALTLARRLTEMTATARKKEDKP